MKSNFTSDMQIEKIIGQWLDTYVYSDTSLFTNVEREFSLDSQHKGIDVVIQSPAIFKDDLKHNVDEKTAIYYVKGNLSESSLPTFAFELNYMKDNQIHDGWLFGEKYSETEYFLVMWVWADVAQIKMDNYVRYNHKQIRYENIMKMEGFFINKIAMRNYAKFLGITPEKFVEYRNRNENKICFKDYANIVISPSLAECPMNLVVHKTKLAEIAKYHFVKEININSQHFG